MTRKVRLPLLPNLPVTRRIGSDLIAVTTSDDPTLGEIAKTEGFPDLINSFTDAFKVHVRPGVMVIDNAKVPPRTGSAIAFRNILALASIPRAWSKNAGRKQWTEVLLYSDYFQMYPYQLAKNGLLAAQNAAGRIINEAKDHIGQMTPALFRARDLDDFYDIELFDALLGKWNDRFASLTPDRSRESAKLFRSLEMAYRASAMPDSNQGSIDDFGAQLALWVSACEILAHDGQIANKSSVLQQLLKSCQFDDPRLNRCDYEIGPKKSVATLIQALYFEMDRARHDFLHGNDVALKSLLVWPDKVSPALPSAAPLIYKAALLTYLGCWDRRQPLAHSSITTNERAERGYYENALRELRPI